MRKGLNKNITFSVLVAAIVIILVFASPFVVRWIATLQKNWTLLSNVGQTYGFAAALLSGLAFIAIAVSLVYQARQIKIAQLQAARTFQLEIFKLAFEQPDLASTWPLNLELHPSDRRKRTYMNLVFMYLRMSYVMREINDDALHRNMINRFKTQLGRKYWEGARDAFRIGAADRRSRLSLPTRRLRFVRVQPSCMALISAVLAQSHLSSNLAFITESGFARPQSCGLQVCGRRPGEFAH